MTNPANDSNEVISEGKLKELSNIAYAAVLMNISGAQDDVFEMLVAQCPGNAVGHIGQALMMLRNQQYDDAIERLRDHAVTAPINQQNAEAVLLFSLYVAGRHDEAQAMANDVVANHEEDSPPHQMAKSLFQLDQALSAPQQAAMPSGISSAMEVSTSRTPAMGGPFVPGMS